MISYSWDFGELDVAPLENGLKDVIKEVSWTLFAREDADGGAVSEMEQGIATLAAPEADSFVKFEDVTKRWLEEALLNATPPINVPGLKSRLAERIEAAKTPPRVKRLPAYKAVKRDA